MNGGHREISPRANGQVNGTPVGSSLASSSSSVIMADEVSPSIPSAYAFEAGLSEHLINIFNSGEFSDLQLHMILVSRVAALTAPALLANGWAMLALMTLDSARRSAAYPFAPLHCRCAFPLFIRLVSGLRLHYDPCQGLLVRGKTCGRTWRRKRV